MPVKERSGFTIIEVMVAIAVASLVILGLFASLIFANKLALLRSCKYEALRIMHEKLEEISGMDYDSVDSSLNNGASSCLDALKNKKNYIERFISNRKVEYGLFYDIVSDASLGIKKVKVEVCWECLGKFREVSGTTVVRKQE